MQHFTVKTGEQIGKVGQSTFRQGFVQSQCGSYHGRSCGVIDDDPARQNIQSDDRRAVGVNLNGSPGFNLGAAIVGQIAGREYRIGGAGRG